MKDFFDGMNAMQNMSVSEIKSYKDEFKLIREIKKNKFKKFILGYSFLGAGEEYNDYQDFTMMNSGIILDVIYRVFRKYPELHVDDLFEKALIEIANNGTSIEVYTGLDIIELQLENEKKQIAPFIVDDIEVYRAYAESIKKNYEELKSTDLYRGKLYEDKLIGYVKEVNKKIEEQKGTRIL